jgi:hypothetical protein
MRLTQHRPIRPFALTVTAAMLTLALGLVWGTGVSFARGETTSTYYEDTVGNLCVGVGGTVGGFANLSGGWPAEGNCEVWAKSGGGK